jgi:hypothetical protein
MNLLEGQRCGVVVIAFDCQVGESKGNWRRTVIAAQTHEDIFGAVAFDTNLTADPSGNWMVLYRPKELALIPRGLMREEELEAHLNAIKP